MRERRCTSSRPATHRRILFLAQFAATVRLQLLAARLTDLRGTDADHAITGARARDELWEAGAPAVQRSGS